MAYNGNGIFQLVPGNPVVTGTVISSTWANNTLSDIANNGLSNCLTKDGQQTPTANIPLGGYRLTGVGNPAAGGDAVNASSIQNGTVTALIGVSGTDTITASTTPAITAYVSGQCFDFIATGPNSTNAVTLNLNTLGAKPVMKAGTSGPVQLTPGDIQTGQSVRVRYDGTQFQVISFLPTSTQTSFRNLIINGNFDVWERGTTFNIGLGGPPQYTADRWVVSNTVGSGGVTTVSQVAIPSGGEPAGAAPIRYALNFQQTVASAGNPPQLITKLESVKTAQNQVVTLSFYAYLPSGSPITITPQLIQYFGSGGSPSSSVFISMGGSANVTTTPAKFVFSASVPSISGKSIGTGGNDALWVVLNMPIGATFNVTIEQVQLELGSSATPFEIRPLALEKSLCQRYFISTAALSLTVANSYSQSLPTKMRIQPAMNLALQNGSGATYTMLVDSWTNTSSSTFFQSAANSSFGTASIKFDADL